MTKSVQLTALHPSPVRMQNKSSIDVAFSTSGPKTNYPQAHNNRPTRKPVTI